AARAGAESWSAAERLATLALLPAGEAGPELLAATRAPEPATRAAAWRGLAANAGYTRDDDARRALLAEMAARLPDERDRIRTEALEALVRLARRTAPFTAADTDPLDRIARHVLAAPDSSDASRTALRDLAVTVITASTLIAADTPAGDRSPVGWAARTLAELAAGPGPVGLGHLDRTLRRGREQLVLTALRPRLETDPGRRLLFALTDALGRRAHRLPELQDLLAAALCDGDDETFRAAARRWLAAPATRSGRVAELLAREPSAIVLPEVLAEVTARRTDLLDPLLGDAPPVGRFLPDPARRPHLGPRHADRLPPRRQQAAVGLARTVAEDVSRTQRERADALRTAAACPDHGRALLLEFAGSSDLMRPGTALAGIALAGLAATGDPAAALTGLAAHTDDGARARAAGHAADRIVARTAAGQLAVTLAELTEAIGKEEVAARKQTVRLYARYLPPDRAAAALADAYRVPGQHPDVLSLIVRRALGLLGTEPVRDLLAEAAATGAPRARLALLTDDPLGLPEAHRPYYARLVAGLAGGRPGEEGESVRRAAVWAMRHWAGYAPETADVVRHAVTDLSSRSGWQSAALVLGGLADSGQPHPLGGAAPGSLLHRTLAELAAAALTPGGPEETGRDLPALRRLDHLVEQGIRRPEILTAAAEHLAHDPELLPARVTLLRRAVDPHAALPDLTRALGALAAAHAGRPALAAESARQLAAHLGHHAPWPDPDAVLAAAERLTVDGGLAAGLLATAVIEACATVSGLPPHWRAVLHTLRGHPVPDVRFAARKVYAAAD
uniref:hypothetical protein n=1 Tax=Kitasatospora sp. MBT63 TaxID=1444768 RepID=UPI00068BFF44